jgi:pimeloyl-ACP methyl ester carboxylesterase
VSTSDAGIETETTTTAHDGTRLYLRQRSGPGGSITHPTAIFCDGIMCDGFIWKYLWTLTPNLMPEAHWNYRGHGRSGHPVDEDAIDVPTHARDLGAVRRAIGDPEVVIIGHSMGCQVALEAYHQRPEKVRALVLLCGSHGRVTHTFKGSNLLSQVLPAVIERVNRRPSLARALWGRVPAEIALHIALRTGEIDPTNVRPEDVRPYFEHLTDIDLPMFLRMLRAAGEHSTREFLHEIRCPVLIVAGEKGSFTPAFLAEEMHAHLPDSELLVVEGGTHVAPLEQHELVDARIERFLRERGLALAPTDAPPIPPGMAHPARGPRRPRGPRWLRPRGPSPLPSPPHRRARRQRSPRLRPGRRRVSRQRRGRYGHCRTTGIS